MTQDVTSNDSLSEINKVVTDLKQKNTDLSNLLADAKLQLLNLKDQVEQLGAPPSGFGIFLELFNDDADVLINGKKMRVLISPEIDKSQLTAGREVILNESLNIISIHGFEISGEIVTLKSLLDDNIRGVVIGRADEERVVRLSENLKGIVLKPGDSLLLDSKSGFVYEKIPKSEVEELVLEEVPDVNYEDIGGLGTQIEQIRDAVELPFLHKDLYAEHQLKAPKGILLYGPPGCGKTLIAKAVANSLAKKVTEKTGNKDGKSYFLNIKGPELLNKYVGETERHIRLIFQRARDKASEGTPVIVFFDEMDSLFKTRGSGVSSDVENTIVPQLLSEIDGVEGLENVIVIGASNREDMIDPAILRPGRLDVKIKIQRPDAKGAVEILSKYLTTELPINQDELDLHNGDKQATVNSMIDKAVEKMYNESDENRFIEVTYANGDKEVLYFKDFSSGAMLENIVSRAKKYAIKEFLSNNRKGIRVEHLIKACLEEFRENEDLPNSTNPDDWARISGKKGERIVFLRTLIQNNHGVEQGRSIETSASVNQFI
ncbi:MAG: proteasome ATPase [Actinomycetota bacterium]|jgi:proteasome-associated ATPase